MANVTESFLSDLVRTHWRVRGSITPLASEWNGAFQIVTSDGAFLLKITPSEVGEMRFRFEQDVLHHLASALHGFAVPHCVPTVSKEREVATENGFVRLFPWIEGTLWANINPHSPELLTDLGRSLGAMSRALSTFPSEVYDIPEIPWSLNSHAWRNIPDGISNTLQAICQVVVSEFETHIFDRLNHLPKCAIYHDANDYNILILPEDRGFAFLDFGDCEIGPAIYDLAICLAYVLMDQGDPLGAAREVVRGYHAEFPVSEIELEALYDLMRVRLVMSVVHAARRKAKDPDNAYWQVSAMPAQALLEKISRIHPHLWLAVFRSACAFTPSPVHNEIRKWLIKNQFRFAPVVGIDLIDEPVHVFDWSVGSASLGPLDRLENTKEQTSSLFTLLELEGKRVGIGKYDEPRLVYSSLEYQVPGMHVPGMRTIHLGIDIFMHPGTPVFAPLDGIVEFVVNNRGDKEYGPLIVLRHETDAGTPFHTLYGHNSIRTLSMVSAGQEIKAGDQIAEIGNYPENGNWVPHLHFQIITDLLGYSDDFPGVADPDHREVWLSLCPDPNLILGIQHPDLPHQYPDIGELKDKRDKLLGPNLGLSYNEPVHFIRGWKTRLYDPMGRSWLDTVNNIAHVGHEHPDVVRAGQQQMTVLNTNTRYLHGNILQCAEQLLSILPEHLEVVWFVNSGSEANELALRIARHVSGNDRTLVLEEGYHGHTHACLEFSHYKFKHGRQADHVDIVPMQMYMEFDDVTAFDQLCGQSIHAGTTFIHEAMPSCAGQIIPDSRCLAELYARVHEAGGICIADEIQTGLGRVGSHTWAFEVFGLRPDVVTIGKPLGNGHPVAAVVCTRELADRFASTPEFFSSFGGNPVSCAIASEVMNVIGRENLQTHALEIGNIWMEHLRRLQHEHPLIGDVRGRGLYLGIEFVEPRSGRPAEEKAKYIQERMLHHRILTSLDGPGQNVMKIKPPMSISVEEVELFVRVFGKVLEEDFVK